MVEMTKTYSKFKYYSSQTRWNPQTGMMYIKTEVVPQNQSMQNILYFRMKFAHFNIWNQYQSEFFLEFSYARYIPTISLVLSWLTPVDETCFKHWKNSYVTGKIQNLESSSKSGHSFQVSKSVKMHNSQCFMAIFRIET